jgi:hypothetical protein
MCHLGRTGWDEQKNCWLLYIQIMLNELYILPYCPACGELRDMKVSTL